MNVRKFIHNSFKILKKPTSEELHIKYLLENNRYSKVYELYQNNVKISKRSENELPYYFLNLLKGGNEYYKDSDGNYFQDSDRNSVLKLKESTLPVLQEFTYFFKLLNSNNSLRENFLKTLSKGLKDIYTNGGHYSKYGDGIFALYNNIMENIKTSEDGFNKNTTELNIEFFKFIDSILKEPNNLPKHFILPDEFVYIYLVENTVTKTKDLDKLLEISDLYPCYLFSPNNEKETSVLSKKNMIEYFKELRYKVEQAKIQKLPSIDLSSDDMQLKLIKSTVKPQISDINQIQAFIESHNLSEDIKKSLNLIESTLNYLNSEKLPSEEQHIVNNIKETLFKNLNDYDNVMDLLDGKDIVDYKTTYSDISSKLYQILADYEKNKLKDLESTSNTTKIKFK